jgi:hypothetical protein
MLPPDLTRDRLPDVLQDIASNISIQPNFGIGHPEYQSLETSLEITSRLQQLPGEYQYKYLRQQLANFLYRAYFNNSLEKIDSSSQSNPERNNARERNLTFYEQLHQNNCGEGYFDSDWCVLSEAGDDKLVVQKDGLTLHVDREIHLHSDQKSATVGDKVAILMPPNLVESGYYVAVGNAGPSKKIGNAYMYFNVNSEGAIALMKAITQQLNAIGIPFTFQVLSNCDEYYRFDSGILYFESVDYGVVKLVVQKIYSELRSHFQMQVPLFTKSLAPGLALAEEPKGNYNEQEDFGMNRFQLVADGLLEAWQQRNESTENRIATIQRHFSLAGISSQSPYLNVNSEDVYTFVS